MLNKCFVFAGKTVPYFNVGLMLGQRRSRWAKIACVCLDYTLVFCNSKIAFIHILVAKLPRSESEKPEEPVWKLCMRI